MNELANTLRMYAEDMHSAVGHSDCSTAMSEAADMLEELEKERDKLILSVADHATARCELAAQNVAMREALNTVLDAVIALEVEQSDYLLRSSVVLKATDALALPDLASEVLKRRDATVESKLLRCLVSGANGGEDGWVTCKDLLDMAAEIEKETDR